MFDQLRQLWRASRTDPKKAPLGSPSQLDSVLTEMGSTLSESKFGREATGGTLGSAGAPSSALKKAGPPPIVGRPSSVSSRSKVWSAMLMAGLVGFGMLSLGVVWYGSRSGDSSNRLQASMAEMASQAARLEASGVTQSDRLKTLQRGMALATDGESVAALNDSVQALREAQSGLEKDSHLLQTQIQALQVASVDAAAPMIRAAWMQTLFGALAVACSIGLVVVQRRESQQRQVEVERARTEALAQEKEAKRINDATQAAILRLMNELQLVAEGDLTQQATVTEDITGAIADSINYTVEELRTLVGQVQGTVKRVGDTTAKVESTSIELLAASTEQLREIRETGQSVLEMAGRITRVSAQAQGSADAARQALQAAESGAQAVQDAIGGMNTIREQIQDTAKRIKRLGESSQEIGEITELISDITEQTNVLALNAAIQAASAGEAGRGFSVVAEEVQRLAERSGDATRQIAVLVRGIQADTQDAIQAMEHSTREVVAGARLSDNAGAALAEIDRLSRQVAELIEQIASAAGREADLAGQTANNIQHIFAVTEQTSEGTRSTVQQVRELARVAGELRQSVSRFKIG